jgi:glycosyltransferase involved in cell wall biosynthesis
LDPEKGIGTLLEAWKRVPEIPLKIRGEGRLSTEVQRWIEVNQRSNVELIGRRSREDLTKLIRDARFLVWPSQGYYETFGYVAVESFGCGVPVLASRIGVQEEIVRDGATGLHFEPGNPADLAEKATWAWNHPSEMAAMGRAARKDYERQYSGERNYPLLMDVYSRAIRNPPGGN